MGLGQADRKLRLYANFCMQICVCVYNLGGQTFPQLYFVLGLNTTHTCVPYLFNKSCLVKHREERLHW